MTVKSRGSAPSHGCALRAARPTNSLRTHVPARRTYRGVFVPGTPARLTRPLVEQPDAVVVDSVEGIAHLAQINDVASLRTFRDGPFRAELLSWMRLSRRDPRWSLDGLNAEAMEMSAIEAAGAGFVLRAGVFEALDRLGLARHFVAEQAVVRSASAIVLFHRPVGEDPLLTGRRFYRLWLEITAAGLSAGPMAVLADDESVRNTIAADFAVPDDRRLITAFRVGRAPARGLPSKPRLPAESLIV